MSDLPSPAATPTRPRHADAEAPDAGLTLLELLVVVTILVLLSAAVGTVALNYLSGAKADAARIQMSQLEAGLDLYRLDIGRYPTEAEGLSALVEAPGGLEAWNGPYVRKESSLVDPWGNAFIYAEAEGGKTFALTSLGADGREGGEDEDADVIN